MTVQRAANAFFFDVGQLAARGELAIPADDTPASECPKPQEPHQTHGSILRVCAAAIVVPVEVEVSCASSLNRNRRECLKTARKARALAARRQPACVLFAERACHEVGTLQNPKSQDPNTKSQLPGCLCETEPGMRRVMELLTYELGLGLWDVGLGICA